MFLLAIGTVNADNFHGNHGNQGGRGNGNTIDLGEQCNSIKNGKQAGCPVEYCPGTASTTQDASAFIFYGDVDQNAVTAISQAFSPLSGRRPFAGPTLRSGVESVKINTQGFDLVNNGEGTDIAFAIQSGDDSTCDEKYELVNAGGIIDRGDARAGKFVVRTWANIAGLGRGYRQLPDFVDHANPGRACYNASSTYPSQAYDLVINSKGQMGVGTDYPENDPYWAGRVVIDGNAVSTCDNSEVVLPTGPGLVSRTEASPLSVPSVSAAMSQMVTLVPPRSARVPPS